MCGWLFASMSGLTRSATRARTPCAIGALIDAIELAGRFDVDRQQAERDGAIDLGGALADAGEHDLIGTEAAAHRDVDFAERIRIGVAAERVQQPDDRQRRIGLERVVNRVRIAVERLVERGVGGADRAGVVDVARRAGGRSDIAQLRGARIWRCRGSGGGHSLDSIPMPVIAGSCPGSAHVHLGAPRAADAGEVTVTLLL